MRSIATLKKDVLPYPSSCDLDNLIKFVLDALNGVLYDDDSRIVGINAYKVWADDPQSTGSTTMQFWSLGDR